MVPRRASTAVLLGLVLSIVLHGSILLPGLVQVMKGKVQPAELSTYEALAEPAWKNRICIRSSDNIYNQSLVASMIAAHGQGETLKWMQGFVANFARKPQGGDRDQIKAAAAGECDIAIANTYYFARMLKSDDPDT